MKNLGLVCLSATIVVNLISCAGLDGYVPSGLSFSFTVHLPRNQPKPMEGKYNDYDNRATKNQRGIDQEFIPIE